MNDTDLISVIIPTYNRAHLIKRSAESVLNQTYRNIELIIVDDGSTDNTKEVIDSIKDDRIVYVKQENKGCCAARNKGIELAKGKYIAFNDSDDVWLPNKLEKQLNTAMLNNADVVWSKVFIYGNLIKRKVPYNFKEGFLEKNTLPLGISAQTLFAKKEVFFNNKFDETIKDHEDFELLLRLMKYSYSIYCLDEALVNYYFQKDSITSNHERQLDSLKDLLKKYNNIIKGLSKQSLESLAEFIICKGFEIKNRKKRKGALNFAFTFNSSKKIKLLYFLKKIHFYKIRALIVKSITIPIKHVINLFRKFI